MIEATRRATVELHRLRQSKHEDADQALRLSRGDDGKLEFILDTPHSHDRVMELAGTPLLITDDSIVNQLDGQLLHFRAEGDDRYGPTGFVLLPRRTGASAA
jgi:hypothetical protein